MPSSATAPPAPVSSAAAPAPFNAAERALIRYEFMRRFGQNPSLADGIWLRSWKSGPMKGGPKVPPALASLLERGLVRVVPGATRHHGHRALFTEAGLAALRLLAQDRRALDPEQYAHLRQELGIDARGAGEGTAGTEEG